jgi:hypothetical protein
VDVSRRSLELLPTSPARARVLAALAGALALVDDEQDPVTVLEQAATEAAGNDVTVAFVLRQLGWTLAVTGDVRAGLRAGQQGMIAAERCGDPHELVASLAALAMLRFLTGSPDARSTLKQAIAVQPPASSVEDRRDLERNRNMMAAWADDLDAASMIAAQRSDAIDRGDAEATNDWQWYALLVRLRTGPWTALMNEITNHENERDRLGIDGQSCAGLWLKALAEAHLGLVDDARDHAAAGIRAAHEEHLVVFALWCEGVLGFVEVASGDHEQAARRLWNLHQRCEAAGIREPGHLRHLPGAVEALVAAGQLPEAGELADHLQALGRVTGHPWAQAAGFRCRGPSYARPQENALPPSTTCSRPSLCTSSSISLSSWDEHCWPTAPRCDGPSTRHLPARRSIAPRRSSTDFLHRSGAIGLLPSQLASAHRQAPHGR